MSVASVRSRVAAERALLAEDTSRAVASARRGASSAGEALSVPARKSMIALVVGSGLIVLGLLMWSPTVALVVAGLMLITYGAVLVDLDVVPARRKRKKKVVE